MRIGMSLLNLRPGKMGGIETYIRKMVEHLPSLPGAELVFFVNDEVESLVPAGAEVFNTGWSSSRTIIERLLEAFTPHRSTAAEGLVTDSKIDVMFYPHQAMFPMRIDVPSVLTVVDVQHLFIPEYFSRFDLVFRARVYAKSLKKCSSIAAISKVTGDSLVEKCGVPPGKIKAIHLGCDKINASAVADQKLMDEPYLYYPAATFPHKGHRQLLYSYAALKRNGTVCQKLVLTGMKTEFWKKLERIIRNEGLQKDVIHLGYLPYKKVLSLYKGADAVLFPTEFEGFGLPVLEAVQFEKKVICSKLSVFDEIGVPKEWQIDYACCDQLSRALDAKRPTQLLHVPNTWKDTAEQTLELLIQSALSGSLAEETS